MVANLLNIALLILMLVYSHKMATLGNPTVPNVGIHNELKPYVEVFYAIAEMKCGHPVKRPALNMDLGKADYFLNTNVAGWCVRTSPLQIMIDKEYFDMSTNYEKEELIFHELGHCILNKDHDESKDSNRRPKSIMYPVTITDSIYRENRTEYINELFADIDCASLK